MSNIYVQIDQRPANQWSNESRDNDRGGMAIIIIVLDLVLPRLWSLDLWLGPSPQHLTRPDAMAMPMAMAMAMAMAMPMAMAMAMPMAMAMAMAMAMPMLYK